jgi:hypothetical protein
MKKMTTRQKKEIARLRALPEEQIDTSDIREVQNWSRAVVGRFYTSRKKKKK